MLITLKLLECKIGPSTTLLECKIGLSTTLLSFTSKDVCAKIQQTKIAVTRI